MHSLHGMDIDEVSLVDIPANQLSSVEIAKRASAGSEETHMAQDDTDVQVDIDDLEEVSLEEAQPGDLVELEDGTFYQLTDEDIASMLEQEAEPVGKSFDTDDLGDLGDIRTELSKAITTGDRDVILSKMVSRLERAEATAREATLVAKSLADRELEGKYVTVAKSWGIPGVDPEELGPVIKRLADVMSEADQQVIAKALRSVGQFAELGSTGMADMADPMGVVDAFVSAGDLTGVSKALEGLTREQVVAKAFAESPAAYDQYLTEHGS